MNRGRLPEMLVLIFLILALPVSGSGQVQILFSHQSVGRNIIADPERSSETSRASSPIRDLLDSNVALWDHDYYNYWLNGEVNAIIDPDGNNWSVATGFGAHRGTSPEQVLMDHLLGSAFNETATGLAQAFRDSCMARFDIVMIKPGYRDVHMNTASSLDAYRSMFNEASDWWHTYNVEHGTNKVLVVMSAPSLRHPSDYSGDDAGWPDTPEGRAEAESDAAAYRELDVWLQDVWVNRHPENRFFSIWQLCVNQTGSASEMNFTKDLYTGTGAGDSSGDHHLNSAGSNDIQAVLAAFINSLADEFENGPFAGRDEPAQGFVLNNPTPNPFNPSTMLSFEIPAPLDVNLSIFDLEGKLIRTLIDEKLAGGRQRVSWQGRDQQGNRVPSGLYLYRVKAGSFSETKRMILLR